MIRIEQLNLQIPHTEADIEKKLRRALFLTQRDDMSYRIIRRSIDARKKPVLYYSYVLHVELKDPKREQQIVNKAGSSKIRIVTEKIYSNPPLVMQSNKTVVVTGSGPGGLFCAYSLARSGITTILLERGEAVDNRRRSVNSFWESGTLDEDSNVAFGEGGAGTFSDGKLNTRVKDKEGRLGFVLSTMVENGADPSIMYDFLPHLGTDTLVSIVKNIRNRIIDLGGEVHFRSKLTDIVIKNGRVCAVEINGSRQIECDAVVMAHGHGAGDTITMLKSRGVHMEPKDFAVGFRVIHPQDMINMAMYGIADPGKLDPSLGPASYHLTVGTKLDRSVYSFCMCPGGFVVDASSGKKMTCVNGMSYSQRDGKYANSAIVMGVRGSEYEGFLSSYYNETKEDYNKDPALCGLYFQRQIEKAAYNAAKGCGIPVMTFGDYKARVAGMKKDVPLSGSVNISAMKGRYVYSDITGILPPSLDQTFVRGMEIFDGMIPGFGAEDTIVAAVESRTSSPVRIPRNENAMSNIYGLFPCGEGAGYAGGIVSAAMDGLLVAEKAIKSIIEGSL